MIDRFRPGEEGLTDRAEEIQARALEYAVTASERFNEGSEFVKSYVNQQPARAVGIALGLGVVVGWLIKRR